MPACPSKGGPNGQRSDGHTRGGKRNVHCADGGVHVDGKAPRVEQSQEPSPLISVAGVDDRPVMLAGLTKLSEISPRISYDASASTVDALLASGTALDVVLLELSLADGSSPGDKVA